MKYTWSLRFDVVNESGISVALVHHECDAEDVTPGDDDHERFYAPVASAWCQIYEKMPKPSPGHMPYATCQFLETVATPGLYVVTDYPGKAPSRYLDLNTGDFVIAGAYLVAQVRADALDPQGVEKIVMREDGNQVIYVWTVGKKEIRLDEPVTIGLKSRLGMAVDGFVTDERA